MTLTVTERILKLRKYISVRKEDIKKLKAEIENNEDFIIRCKICLKNHEEELKSNLSKEE